MVSHLLAVTFALGIALATIGGCSPPTEPVGCQTDVDCEDDGLFCNGVEVCETTGECVSSGSPCADNLVCNEAQGRCQECLVDDECESDGLICNGEEICNDSGECVSSGSPCNEGRVCNEDEGRCQECLVDDDCEDDGIFCNGEEVCDDSGECVGAGSPCSGDEMCSEYWKRCQSCLVDDDCDNGGPCTFNQCLGGECEAIARDCGEDAECNPETGLCGLQDGTDPCVTLCLNAVPFCEETGTEGYGDFETTLRAWTGFPRCTEDGGRWALGGECESGMRFVYIHDWAHQLVLFFSGDTGEFIGRRFQSDLIEQTCVGLTYWPMWFECENPVVTEVECGWEFETGDKIELPGHQDWRDWPW